MITGKIEIVDNKIVFVSHGVMYIIPYDLYNPAMLNKKYKAKVNSIRKTVEELNEV